MAQAVSSQPIREDRVAARREHFELIRSHSIDGSSFEFLSQLTDLGNAERFAFEFVDCVRYCDPFGFYLVHDGRRWVRDEQNTITNLVKKMIRGGYAEISRITDSDRRARIAEHLSRSESAARIRACTELVKSELPVMPDQLDADLWLLNLENGTLDLRTLELRPHSADDLVTKLAGTHYDPDALCPTWEATLDRVFGKQERLIDYFRRACGYSLTAETGEHCLFFMIGSGANGKSTVLGALLELMGDYAAQTGADTFLSKRSDQIPNDLARLKGARLVSAIEADQGRRLAEGLVKQLTGGDKIAARFLHAEWFEFRPAFKLFFASNHKPVIRGTDLGIWRRIRLIPFEVTIPAEEQDPELPAKLREELAGILNWCLLGLEEWKAERLGYPEEIATATAAYRAEMDDLGAFLDECCVLKNYALTSCTKLTELYENWRSENGGPEISKRKLAAILRERGFDSVKKENGVHFLGIEARNG